LIKKYKNFIRDLQSVDYSILLANAPAQWPTPVIQEGYDAVIINHGEERGRSVTRKRGRSVTLDR